MLRRYRGPHIVLQLRALAHVGEHPQIDEVHAAEHQKNKSDLGAQEFDGLLQVRRLIAVFERQRHISDVDQIKADDQQMIDRVGQLAVVVERFHQKDQPILGERPRHPNGEQHADQYVKSVGPNDVHVGRFHHSLLVQI